jgi:hypothetical protein
VTALHLWLDRETGDESYVSAAIFPVLSSGELCADPLAEEKSSRPRGEESSGDNNPEEEISDTLAAICCMTSWPDDDNKLSPAGNPKTVGLLDNPIEGDN